MMTLIKSKEEVEPRNQDVHYLIGTRRGESEWGEYNKRRTFSGVLSMNIHQIESTSSEWLLRDSFCE